MEHEIEVEVFRAGDYGPRGVYSEEDLARIASDYEPGVHEAPVTVDHRQEGPALGWVRSLRRTGKVLLARLGALNGEFIEQLRTGAFKKRSIELYRAAEWTGRPYLRSLTFLGACPPAVKGLADLIFAESPDGNWIEFDEEENATSVAPQGAEETKGDQSEDSGPAFAESDAAKEVPSNDDAITDEGAVIANAETWSENAEASHSSLITPDSSFDDVTHFCEKLQNEGRFLPAWSERGIERFLILLDNANPVSFSESAESSQTLRAWFQDFLRSLPPFVPMGESAAQFSGGRYGNEPVGFVERNGVRIDPESLSLHQRVMRYIENYPQVTYGEALRAVAGN